MVNLARLRRIEWSRGFSVYLKDRNSLLEATRSGICPSCTQQLVPLIQHLGETASEHRVSGELFLAE
jgi:hypothetical protein